MAKIGFIGLGIMGSGMAHNLADAGHDVLGWTRSPSRGANDLGRVTSVDTIAAAVREAEFIFVSVTGPQAQRDVIGRADGAGIDGAGIDGAGILAHAPHGALILDATTTDPDMSRGFAEQFRARGVSYADMPVFGSRIESRDGRLDVMFGGSHADCIRAEPLLREISKTITHVGPVGAAMSMKLIGNLMVASQFMALAEGMALARRTGIRPSILAQMLDHVDFGSGLLRANVRSAADGDFSPSFQLKDMLKDACLVEDLGRRTGVPTLAGSLAAQSLAAAVNTGHAHENVSALVAHVEALSRRVCEAVA